MKVVINEHQLLPIYEAYQNNFSFETLSKICSVNNLRGDNDVRYEYCVKHLGEPVSEGSSRVVFSLSDNYILKLAFNNPYMTYSVSVGAGQAQNKIEFETYKKLPDDLSSLVARILYCDKNYNFMVCENVVPAENVDFEKILGIPFTNIWRQNTSKTSENDNVSDETIGYNKYFDNLKGEYEEYEGPSVYDILCYIETNYVLEEYSYDEEIEEIIRNSEWFTKLVDFVEFTQTSDFTSVENFGIVNRNGKPTLVLLDYGMNMDMWEKYYG